MFAVEDEADADDVDSGIDEFGDAFEPGQFVVAVPAGARAGTEGSDQPVLLRAGPAAVDKHWPGTPAGLAAVRRLVGIRPA